MDDDDSILFFSQNKRIIVTATGLGGVVKTMNIYFGRKQGVYFYFGVMDPHSDRGPIRTGATAKRSARNYNPPARHRQY
jgi:hypothetical protein